jgi:hypothetical protein
MGTAMTETARTAARLAAGTAAGAEVLQIACAADELTRELSRLGLRPSTVDPCTWPDGGRLPAGRFALAVHQAALTDLDRPVHALDELHRALRPGGTAVLRTAGHEAAEELLELARCSLFGGGVIRSDGVSPELWLRKPPDPSDG